MIKYFLKFGIGFEKDEQSSMDKNQKSTDPHTAAGIALGHKKRR